MDDPHIQWLQMACAIWGEKYNLIFFTAVVSLGCAHIGQCLTVLEIIEASSFINITICPSAGIHQLFWAVLYFSM